MISLIQLGQVDYATGLRLQQRLVELRKTGAIGDVLLLLEHTPVITLGRNAKAANILMPAEDLAARGVEVFECDRGGDVTFHGPGQIVGYPILDLRGFGRTPFNSPDTRSQVAGFGSQEELRTAESFLSRRGTLGAVDYVRHLEGVLIRACGDFGIATKRVPGLTGVWTENLTYQDDSRQAGGGPSTLQNSRGESPRSAQEAKIAAIGVHISHSVTSHGFALNVNTDLSYFNLIVPCGIRAKQVTSMKKELGHEVELSEVAHSLSRNFGAVFGQQMLWVESLDALLGQTVGVPMKVPKELRALSSEDDLFLA